MTYSDIRLSMIVAVATNGVIGNNNQLPWHLPKDLQYFKATTMGKPIIMGRNTYESIGRPLPGRMNIVVSQSYSRETPDVKSGAIELAVDVDQAVVMAKEQAALDGVDEVMVIGGAQIYNAIALDADRLYLTRVHSHVEGDTFFNVKEDDWKEVSRQDFQACPKNPFNYSFLVLER